MLSQISPYGSRDSPCSRTYKASFLLRPARLCKQLRVSGEILGSMERDFLPSHNGQPIGRHPPAETYPSSPQSIYVCLFREYPEFLADHRGEATAALIEVVTKSLGRERSSKSYLPGPANASRCTFAQRPLHYPVALAGETASTRYACLYRQWLLIFR